MSYYEDELCNKRDEIRNSVSLSDISSLVLASEHCKGPSDEVKIYPYVDKENDTLAFAVSYQNRWILYAGDKRVPPILAECEKGCFDEIAHQPGAEEWIQSTLDNIKIIKSLDDEMLNFSEDEIRSCREFWGQTLTFPPQPSGHYVRGYVYYTDDVCDSIPHLMSTRWHQRFPFNAYCPYIADSMTSRCPAGCVAIAGAQVLYYLHYFYGVPESAPSSAYCYGHESVNPNDIPDYDWDQTDFSSDIWDEMPLTGDGFESENTNASPLIANIGKLDRIKYKYNGSTGSTERLQDVFNYYGISSEYRSFNDTLVKESLLTGVPVIVRATNGYSGSGHSFVIDGYLRKRTYAVTVYRWEWDSPGAGGMYPIIQPEDMYETQPIGLPYISMVKMNWGWGPGLQWDGNDAWFTLTDDWYIDFTPSPCDYTSSTKRMLYNFSPIVE